MGNVNNKVKTMIKHLQWTKTHTRRPPSPPYTRTDWHKEKKLENMRE